MSESRIGVVVYGRDDRPDAVLREAVQRLKFRGRHIGGLLQDGQSTDPSDCRRLFLEDIETGRRIQAFEMRGSGARGCRLDFSRLAEAAGWLRTIIARRPDALFINRFGRQEAAGRGLRDEIAAAIATGLPVVIAVSEKLLPEWFAFAGPEFVQLAPDPKQIEAWCMASMDPVTSATENISS